MNKDSTDFMIEEYTQIASAFFSLQSQLTEIFKVYLTLIGLPLTAVAALWGSAPSTGTGGTNTIELDSLPPLIWGLLLVVSVLGLFVALTMIHMRLEMILYARTMG